MFLILMFLIYVTSYYYLLYLAFFCIFYIYFQPAMASAIGRHTIRRISMAGFSLTAMSRHLILTTMTKTNSASYKPFLTYILLSSSFFFFLFFFFFGGGSGCGIRMYLDDFNKDFLDDNNVLECILMISIRTF